MCPARFYPVRMHFVEAGTRIELVRKTRSGCRGRLFGRERPKIIPDFQIHPVNVGEKTRRGQAIVFSVGFRLANLRHLPFELTDTFLRDFQFAIVVNRGQPGRRVRLILATDSSASDSELYRLIALG